jgi:energy-coupling factor transporter transmembrane protein EcfT
MRKKEHYNGAPFVFTAIPDSHSMNSFNSWPQRAHPVLAVLLAVAICALPILLPHAGLNNLMANLFAYLMACIVVYPFAALARRRITSLPMLWLAAALCVLALCFFHTNILADSADLPWPQKRDATLVKFLFNLPQFTLGVLCWWLLVTRPDRRDK